MKYIDCRKIYFLLVGSALIFCPIVVQAYQIAPDPNYSTINITTPDARNSEYFYNYGALAISSSGVLNNDGGIHNLGASARIENDGVLNNGSVGDFAWIAYGQVNN